MLSPLDFPIVVFVDESNDCIKQVLLKWARKVSSCYWSDSLRERLEAMLQRKYASHNFL